MHYLDIPERSTAPTLILVHGSWHDGGCWSAVRAQLAAAGVHSIAPTLPGHGADDDRLNVSHDDYVRTVVDALDALDRPSALVGHSFGGSVISRVAELRPKRCSGLIYYSAFVPRHGESVADSLPAAFIEFLDQAAAASADRAIALPDGALGESFANTADEHTLALISSMLVPEPYAPIFEPLSLPNFPNLEIPTAYIICRNDRALPPGTFHPTGRLRAPELIEIEGDHESLLTAPQRLGDALLDAFDALEVARRGRGSAVVSRARS